MSAPATSKEKEAKRWLRALGIAKCLFDEQGYHIDYLEQIEVFIKTNLCPATIKEGSRGDYPPQGGSPKKRRTKDGRSTKNQVDRF